jgi:hypothetical protein
MKTNELTIRSYSLYPGPRYSSQGDCSGEEFYHKALNKAFAETYSKDTTLSVDLDGTAGYASSFLDEAFGNLIYDFSEEIVKKKVVFISKQEPDWMLMLLNEVFPEWEQRRRNKQSPKKTITHEPWFKIINGKLEKDVWT